MFKIIPVDPIFEGTGELSIRVINDSVLKTASSEAADYFESIPKPKNKTLILVLAMGASEYWGQNRRGDYWPEQPIAGMVEENETLLARYKTFESDAKIYLHHINMDPNRSIGDVLKAFYNFKMHRVELILAIDNEKGRAQVEALKDNKFLPVSMGAKVVGDYCTICGHFSKNISEYCDHARKMMNKIFEDGKKVGVINKFPTFKDISIVNRPADPTAYTQLIKAASVEEHNGNFVLSAEEGNSEIRKAYKTAFLNKFSDIYKRIIGHVQDVSGSSLSESEKKNIDFIRDKITPVLKSITGEDLSESEQDVFSNMPISNVVKSFLKKDMFLSTDDLIGIIGKKMNLSSDLVDKIKDIYLDIEPSVLDVIKDRPDTFDKFVRLLGFDEDSSESSSSVDREITPDIMQKKSYMKEFIKRRVVPRPLQEDWEPQMETIEISDDKGNKVVTTRGAIWKARQDIGKKNLLGALGLLGGSVLAYKIMTSSPMGALILGPMAAYGAYKGIKHISNKNKPTGYFTSDDEDIPEFTEFKKSSSDGGDNYPSLPVAIGISAATLLPMLKKRGIISDNSMLGDLAEHPILAGLLASGIAYAAKNASMDNQYLPDDFNAVVNFIGRKMLEAVQEG